MDANEFFERGKEYAGKREWDRAIADYTEAIRLDPGNAAIYRNHLQKVERLPPTASENGRAAGCGVTIPVPVAGIILRYAVDEGAVVAAGDTIVIIESMKMELEIKATAGGVVHFLVPTGVQVASQQPIAEIDR